MMMSKFIKE